NPPPRQAVLELGPTPVIPLRTMNTIVPLRFGNLDQLTFNYRRLTAFGLKRGITPGASRKVNLLERPELSAPKDHIVNGSLGIRGLLDGRSGVVWGSLNWAPDSPYRPYPFLGEVTPWQMLVKVGHYNTLVWLNSFGTGRPIRGATVKLWHCHDENLGKLSAFGNPVTTNENGVAVLHGTVQLPTSWFRQWKDDSDYYVGATRDGVLSFLPLDWNFRRSLGISSLSTV